MPHSRSEYTVEIPLSPDVENRFRRWVERTPGATWPKWGGHITILDSFVPRRGIEPVVGVIEPVCTNYAPFEIRFDSVMCDAYWVEPHLRTVLMVSSSHDEDGCRALVDLHRSFRKELARVASDVRPEVSDRPYVPHLSLTAGIPQPAALELMEAARAARLKVEFVVRKISLLEFVEGTEGEKDARLVRSFELTEP